MQINELIKEHSDIRRCRHCKHIFVYHYYNEDGVKLIDAWHFGYWLNEARNHKCEAEHAEV